MSPAVPFFVLILWVFLAYARVFDKLDPVLGPMGKRDFTEFTIFFFGAFAIVLWGAYLAS